jgi:hypothetical protein
MFEVHAESSRRMQTPCYQPGSITYRVKVDNEQRTGERKKALGEKGL